MGKDMASKIVDDVKAELRLLIVKYESTCELRHKINLNKAGLVKFIGRFV